MSVKTGARPFPQYMALIQQKDPPRGYGGDRGTMKYFGIDNLIQKLLTTANLEFLINFQGIVYPF